jgi:hypothetical protein
VTNRTGDVVALDRDRRAHAVSKTVIRDLKHGARLMYCTSGAFNPNAKTPRRRLLTIPARFTRTARRWTLHVSLRPWQHVVEDTEEDSAPSCSAPRRPVSPRAFRLQELLR